MSVTVEAIAGYLEELAPVALALPGDRVGLQVGDPHAAVGTILVALELDQPVLEQAVRHKADLVVTHHPLFYDPVENVDESCPRGALAAAVIRNRISVYSAHTNLDAAPRGLNRRLADLLGLSAEGRRIIDVTGKDRLLKLVVFVPLGHEDTVRNALAGAGAGWIGGYSHCTFQAPGTGTFMPREGTDPFIGRQGRLEKVAELRLETILPAARCKAVLRALEAAHPYEEVAYDLYTLDQEGEPVGLGLIGDLEAPRPLAQILERCRTALRLTGLRYWAPEKEAFSRLAVCSGSGGSLVEQAARQGAELFISGDFRHHDFQKAFASGMGLVDAGHYGTEQPVVDLLVEHLRECLARDGRTAAVVPAQPAPAEWRYA